MKTTKKELGEVWRPKKFLKVYDGMIETFGHTKGLILSTLINRYDLSKRYGKLNNGSFYLLRDDIEKRTGCDKNTVVKYLKELKEADKIIKTSLLGHPPKQWYTLNFGEIGRRLNRTEISTVTNRTENSTVSQNGEKLASRPFMGKSTDSYKKHNRTENSTVNNNRTNKVLNITIKEIYEAFLTEGFPKQWLESAPFKIAVRRWICHLQEKGKEYTPSQVEQEVRGLVKEYDSPGKLIDAIDFSIRRGWLSIYPKPEPKNKDICPLKGWVFGESFSTKQGCRDCEDHHYSLYLRCRLAHEKLIKKPSKLK
jgi:hypothetical protein